jgi:predicted ATPase
LNGLQVTAKQEEFEITNEDINILYFHDNEDTYFTQIPLKPNGKIEVWKDGFFDQSEKDLDTILGL